MTCLGRAGGHFFFFFGFAETMKVGKEKNYIQKVK